MGNFSKILGITLLLLIVLPAEARRTRHAADTIYTNRPDTLQLDTVRRYGISIRDNLFWNIAGVPNLGVEIPLGKHFSVGGNAALKPWPRFLPWDNDQENESKWKHLAAVPELRFWLDEIYNGLFVGADLVYTHYNVGKVTFPLGMYPQVRDHRVQGDFYGLGLFAGYSWWLSDHWRLEAEAGAALGWAAYGLYDCAHCGTYYGQESKLAVVPKLGLNIAYNVRPRPEEKEYVILPEPMDTVEIPDIVVPPFNPLLYPVEPWKGVAGQLEKDNPILRPSAEYQPYTPNCILRKEEGALYVHFELDKTRLLYDFRDNGPILDQIMNITRQIMADTTSSVSCIQIIGLASIEGKVAHNQDLSDGRALALQQYIQDRLPVPDSLFDTVGGGEAWTEFRDQVNDLLLAGGNENLFPQQVEKVLEIIDTEPDPDRREARIRSIQSGKVYRALQQDLLQDQRNSGYLRIYYDVVPDKGAEAINTAIGLLEEGKDQEALALLETVKDDDRAASAYALALYRAGRNSDALAVMARAAGNGDNAVIENYRRLQNTVRAEREKERMLRLLNPQTTN